MVSIEGSSTSQEALQPQGLGGVLQAAVGLVRGERRLDDAQQSFRSTVSRYYREQYPQLGEGMGTTHIVWPSDGRTLIAELRAGWPSDEPIKTREVTEDEPFHATANGWLSGGQDDSSREVGLVFVAKDEESSEVDATHPPSDPERGARWELLVLIDDLENVDFDRVQEGREPVPYWRHGRVVQIPTPPTGIGVGVAGTGEGMQ